VSKEAACLLWCIRVAPARSCELTGLWSRPEHVCADARARGVPSHALNPRIWPLPGQPWRVEVGCGLSRRLMLARAARSRLL
jgi:hypothetical protein